MDSYVLLLMLPCFVSCVVNGIETLTGVDSTAVPDGAPPEGALAVGGAFPVEGALAVEGLV